MCRVLHRHEATLNLSFLISRTLLKFLVIGKQDTYFVRNHSDCTHKYSEVDIKSMLGLLIDNIYVVFGNHVFEHSVGIPMGTYCVPLLADLFLYSYEAEFVQKLLRDKNKKTCRVLQPYL